MQNVTLESLELSEAEPQTLFLPENRLNQIKNQAFESGREQGYTTAKVENDTARAAVLQEISQKLEAFEFTHYEARQAVLCTLQPLVEKIFEKLFPTLIDSTFLDFAMKEILEISRHVTDGSLEICCSKETASFLQAEFARQSKWGERLEVRVDEDLSDHTVRIEFLGGGRMLDLDAALASITHASTEFFNAIREKQAHG